MKMLSTCLFNVLKRRLICVRIMNSPMLYSLFFCFVIVGNISLSITEHNIHFYIDHFTSTSHFCD